MSSLHLFCCDVLIADSSFRMADKYRTVNMLRKKIPTRKTHRLALIALWASVETYSIIAGIPSSNARGPFLIPPQSFSPTLLNVCSKRSYHKGKKCQSIKKKKKELTESGKIAKITHLFPNA